MLALRKGSSQTAAAASPPHAPHRAGALSLDPDLRACCHQPRLSGQGQLAKAGAGGTEGRGRPRRPTPESVASSPPARPQAISWGRSAGGPVGETAATV